MNYENWCQMCIWRTNPLMLSTFYTRGKCDRCNRFADLALVEVDHAIKDQDVDEDRETEGNVTRGVTSD